MVQYCIHHVGERVSTSWLPGNCYTSNPILSPTFTLLSLQLPQSPEANEVSYNSAISACEKGEQWDQAYWEGTDAEFTYSHLLKEYKRVVTVEYHSIRKYQ